jgi:hypothetical protein
VICVNPYQQQADTKRSNTTLLCIFLQTRRWAKDGS